MLKWLKEATVAEFLGMGIVIVFVSGIFAVLGILIIVFFYLATGLFS